ncbi:receptor-like protein 12 [Vigna radiata var. radiata]|uniref:Receptor-like protein 12 n=1 Tax=Vigna radiata var. radiata TaxID=3916 RepID=A0A1S3U182_VIGRR|nr:receptor-like protein 12 [Vigna radiata var. radiata]
MLSTWRDDQNDTDCCTWKGIECKNETGYVERVDLRASLSHYLSGPINITSLVGLQKLKYLDLSSNDRFIGSQIPPSIASFQSLRYLDLSRTSFLGTIPYELGNLSKLEYLDLKETNLYGEIPTQLAQLSSLRYLDLSTNFEISGEIPSQLGSLSHLRYLDLSGNSLSGVLPFQVGNLPLLHSLSLDGNYGLKIKDENWLSSLSSLTILCLHSFPYLGISNISKHLPNLRELSVNNCALSDADISLLFPSHSNISTSLSILSL